jgi:uncharacterized protein YjbI with pentapeptide repeats
MRYGSSRRKRREARAMDRSAADRIRSMQEKGTLTPEQAEELLKALSEDAEGGPGAASEDPGVEAGGAETAGAHEEPEGDVPPGRHGRRRSRSFFDMEWVDDMVGGITSGLGISPDRGDSDYHYEWDPRRGGRRGGNAQDSSRVEAPEGDSFEFRGNRVAFSKLSGMRYVRSRVKDNSFSASTFKDAELIDSTLEDSSFAGASVHELRMEDSAVKGMVLAGAKVARMSLSGRSTLKDTKIAGGSLTGLSLSGGSSIEDTRFSGSAVNALSLSDASLMKDCRLNGVAVSRVTLEGGRFKNARINGCALANSVFAGSEIEDSALRGVRLRDSEIRNSRIKDSRFEGIAFEGLHIQGCRVSNTAFRDPFHKAFGLFQKSAEKLSLVDCELENVEFVDCTFRETTFKGIKAKDLRLRGVDFSGKTFERAEDLEALAGR